MIFAAASVLVLVLPGGWLLVALARALDRFAAQSPLWVERAADAVAVPPCDTERLRAELLARAELRLWLPRVCAHYFPGCGVSVTERIDSFGVEVEIRPSPAFRFAALLAPCLTRVVALLRLGELRAALEPHRPAFVRVVFRLVGFPGFPVGEPPTKVND